MYRAIFSTTIKKIAGEWPVTTTLICRLESGQGLLYPGRKANKYRVWGRGRALSKGFLLHASL